MWRTVINLKKILHWYLNLKRKYYKSEDKCIDVIAYTFDKDDYEVSILIHELPT